MGGKEFCPAAMRTVRFEDWGLPYLAGMTFGPAETSAPFLTSLYQLMVTVYSPSGAPSPPANVESLNVPSWSTFARGGGASSPFGVFGWSVTNAPGAGWPLTVSVPLAG